MPFHLFMFPFILIILYILSFLLEYGILLYKKPHPDCSGRGPFRLVIFSKSFTTIRSIRTIHFNKEVSAQILCPNLLRHIHVILQFYRLYHPFGYQKIITFIPSDDTALLYLIPSNPFCHIYSHFHSLDVKILSI